MSFSFGEGFFHDHAGQILEDPAVALVELLANSYDAGATRVDITMPATAGSTLSIEDNGTGMSPTEFKHRWGQFSYNRIKEQGDVVQFPADVKGQNPRRAFGRNGKGRHAAFCFADSYVIETWQGNVLTKADVELVSGTSEPFRWVLGPPGVRKGHGTSITVKAVRGLLDPQRVRDLVGTKFMADPSLQVFVNKTAVHIGNVSAVSSEEIDVAKHGKVRVLQIDGAQQEKIGLLKGITWWVNRRMVGESSWGGLDGEGAYLDGRTAEAKKYSFIVEADLLATDVKADWSGFHANRRVVDVRDAVHAHVVKKINLLLASTRKERKREVLERNKKLLGELAPDGRRLVGAFVDQIQERCPGMTERDLARAVSVLGKLEQSRSGYDLLRQLAACSPDDLDTWHTIMESWTAENAQRVLGEIERRLRVIREMAELTKSPHSDELHDLQPVFERGLWVFGPEYESVDFRSNRTIAEVVTHFLGGTDEALAGKKRPDFVVLPDTSIGFYGAPSYSATGEITGHRKVLIVELKRGAFNISQKELDQARDYTKEIRKAGHVTDSTIIHACVLGHSVSPDVAISKIGANEQTVIEPCTYQTILARAHARTFNLQHHLTSSNHKAVVDTEVEFILTQFTQSTMFDEGKSAPPS